MPERWYGRGDEPGDRRDRALAGIAAGSGAQREHGEDDEQPQRAERAHGHWHRSEIT